MHDFSLGATLEISTDLSSGQLIGAQVGTTFCAVAFDEMQKVKA